MLHPQLLKMPNTHNNTVFESNPLSMYKSFRDELSFLYRVVCSQTHCEILFCQYNTLSQQSGEKT